MADYHTTYQRGEGETTQWEDLQRKFGNLPPKEPVPKPAAFAPAAEERKDTQWLDERGEDELEVLDEETSDDRFLEAYRCAPGLLLLVTRPLYGVGRTLQDDCWRRKKRLAELHRARGRIQFGSVRQITRTEFVQEVSAASDLCWVVVHLFKDGCA